MGRIKSIAKALIIPLLVAVVATGCGGGTPAKEGTGQEENDGVDKGGFPVTIVDSLGREVTVEAEPQKVISLSPAITEILFAIGAEDKVAGVTEYCDYPPEALEKTKMGSFESPNLELIIETDPDLIFVAAGIQVEFVKQFDELGYKVIVLDAERLDQVTGNIELAGKVTGCLEQAREVVNDMENRIAAVKDKVSSAKCRPAVFFEVWDNPLMTAGPGTFIDDMITTAGGENIAGDLTERYAEFSREVLMVRDPDIYIINSHAHTPEEVKKRPGYSGLKAVQNNRVYSIEDDLVTLPGPRIVEGLEQVARAIHPELY